MTAVQENLAGLPVSARGSTGKKDPYNTAGMITDGHVYLNVVI